jgi:hypothetical protein
MVDLLCIHARAGLSIITENGQDRVHQWRTFSILSDCLQSIQKLDNDDVISRDEIKVTSRPRTGSIAQSRSSENGNGNETD